MRQRADVVVVAGAALALLGCEAAPRGMDWRIRFADPGLEPRAVLIEARVLRGRCGDRAAEVVYTALFDPGERAPRPPVLGPGEHSLEAYARDATCTRFAGDCSDQRLPQPAGTVVDLVLQESPAVALCQPGEACEDGRCASEAQDAGPPPQDVGPPPPRDAGACVPPPELTIEACERGVCAAGRVCFNRAGDGVSARCVPACAGASDCLPGWTCDPVEADECDPPPCAVPSVCRCEPDGFGGGSPFSPEQCNAEDDDCDGRVDEEGAFEFPLCFNGGDCRCGACVCPAGEVDCDGSCTTLATDERSCGFCGNRCGPGFDCREGSCRCEATICGDECVSLSADARHCGTCDRACGPGFECSGGTCICRATACMGTCVDTTRNPSHCGGCGNACAVGQSCCGGVCVDTTTSAMHCGGCGTACAAGQTCCSSGCVDTTTSTSHCGTCGRACGAMESCSAGVCTAVM